MKTIEEYIEEMDNASGSMFDRATSLHVLKKVQQDAWKQGMLDAAKMCDEEQSRLCNMGGSCYESSNAVEDIGKRIASKALTNEIN